jgi:hypothetical protein
MDDREHLGAGQEPCRAALGDEDAARVELFEDHVLVEVLGEEEGRGAGGAGGVWG